MKKTQYKTITNLYEFWRYNQDSNSAEIKPPPENDNEILLNSSFLKCSHDLEQYDPRPFIKHD